jgi:hypothetical protein
LIIKNAICGDGFYFGMIYIMCGSDIDFSTLVWCRVSALYIIHKGILTTWLCITTTNISSLTGIDLRVLIKVPLGRYFGGNLKGINSSPVGTAAIGTPKGRELSS